MKEENGPLDIKLHENLITFRGKNIEVQMTTEKIRKVLAADNFIIPAYCEKLIDVFIDRYEDDQDLTYNVFCVEPSEDFNNRFSLMMASCVIDLKDQVSTKIRVMNPFKMDVCLKQDDLLGKTELVNPQDIKIIFSEDCEQSNQAVRRIQLDDCLQKEDNYSKIKESNTFQGSYSSRTTNVPDYLLDLYYRAVQEMTSDESQKISDLLCRYIFKE